MRHDVARQFVALKNQNPQLDFATAAYTAAENINECKEEKMESGLIVFLVFSPFLILGTMVMLTSLVDK